MFKSLYKLALAGLALGLLAGCGGGSGGSQLNPVSTTPTVTLTTTATGDLRNEVASGLSIQVTAVVKDSNGNVLPGTIVTFSVDDSTSVTLKSSKIVTGADGSATVNLSANAVSADTAVAVTASAAVLSVSGSTTKTTTVTATTNLKVTQSTSTATTTLQYVSATPTRLVIAGASSGSGTLSESSVITYKVLNPPAEGCTSVSVYFYLSTFNGGVTLGGYDPAKVTSPEKVKAVKVNADSSCLATVTIKSGTEPESIKVYASLDSANDINKLSSSSWVAASDQIAISSSIPDQLHFSLGWQPGAACATGKASYPCAVLVTVGDFMGHPAPDGTLVIFATSQQGLVIGTTDSGGNATGYCKTKAGQCTANVYGDIIVSGFNDKVTGSPMINNELVAFAIGDSVSVNDAAKAIGGHYTDNQVGPWDCSGTAASTAICVNTFTINYDNTTPKPYPASSTPKPQEIIKAADGVQYVRARLRW